MTESKRLVVTDALGISPPIGDRYAALSPDDSRVEQIMRNAAPYVDVDEDSEEDIKDDIDIDLTDAQNNMADALGITRDGKSEVLPQIPPLPHLNSGSPLDKLNLDTEQKPLIVEESDDESLMNEESLVDTKEEASITSTKAGIVACGIVLIIAIVIFLVSNLMKKQDVPINGETSSSASIAMYQNDTVTETDPQLYEDSMIISKYFYFDKDACMFVFEGYAQNARAFVKAYVDNETYNTYRTGARVSIVYKRIEIQGTFYYTEVKVI